MVNSSSEPIREKDVEQELPSCRAEVPRTPLTSTHEPADRGVTVLVCVGRFAIKCKGRKKKKKGRVLQRN